MSGSCEGPLSSLQARVADSMEYSSGTGALQGVWLAAGTMLGSPEFAYDSPTSTVLPSRSLLVRSPTDFFAICTTSRCLLPMGALTRPATMACRLGTEARASFRAARPRKATSLGMGRCAALCCAHGVPGAFTRPSIVDDILVWFRMFNTEMPHTALAWGAPVARLFMARVLG